MPLQLIFTGPVTINQVDQGPVLDAIDGLRALVTTQGATMTEALSNLQAADAALDTQVAALVTEQAQFLTDISAALSAAGTDPAALQAVADDINAQAAKLSDLAAAQVAADPSATTPEPAPAEPTA